MAEMSITLCQNKPTFRWHFGTRDVTFFFVLNCIGQRGRVWLCVHILNHVSYT